MQLRFVRLPGIHGGSGKTGQHYIRKTKGVETAWNLAHLDQSADHEAGDVKADRQTSHGGTDGGEFSHGKRTRV